MKPSWEYAPDWAKYLAMGLDGGWRWFEEKPSYVLGEWITKNGLVQMYCNTTRARFSLEER